MFDVLVDELTECSDTALVERIEANELERRRLDAEMSALLAVADVRSTNTATGHRTMTAFCRARLNWSTVEATRRLSMARAVNEVSGLGAAWIAGRFGLPQVAKLAATNANPRVTGHLPQHAPQLLLHAEQMPYSDFAEVIDHFVDRADEDGTHDDRDAATDGRRARVVDVGGMLDMRATGGGGLETAEIIEIFHRFTDLEYQQDLGRAREQFGNDHDAHPLGRTDRQRRFDALLTIFRTAAAHDGVAPPTEPLVNINIDARTWGRMLTAAGLSTDRALDGHPIDPFTGLPVDDTDRLLGDLTVRSALDTVCRTTNGVRLHPHDVLRAALGGHVRRVVFDSQRVVIDMSRRQRLFTGSARRAARQLVRRCERAGCEFPVDWCDVDHVDEWERHGGRTDQSNAAILCRHDNNDKHVRRWRTRRATNGSSYTVRADGSIELPVGARAPTFADRSDHSGRDLDDDSLDSPEEIARLTAIARSRIAALRSAA